MKKITTLLCGLFLFFSVVAQGTEPAPLEKLQISGYIQTQYLQGESINRIGVRRGRIKLSYEEGMASGVFQLDVTEKGVGLKDAYLNVKDAWFNSLQLRAGVFNRPFGNEISYSSARRESPERSTLFQTLFPDERDLGVMLVLQAPKTSSLHFLKLEAGLFAGNGIKPETDNRKDFIAHLSAAQILGSDISWSLGASYYKGGVYQGSENVYTLSGKGFVLNDEASNKGKFSNREYFGLDAQFLGMTALGMTQLRVEYIRGQQPGIAGSSKSPNSPNLPVADTYIRNFRGGYVIFVQDIGTFPFSVVLKYDCYDPNTKVSGNEIGVNGTSSTDLFQDTFGFGALWRINNSLRMQAFYEINTNETTGNIESMNKDVKDNLFTLRLQYKF
jgi:hypothetical protein